MTAPSIPYVAHWTSEEEQYIAPEPLAENMPAIFTRGPRGEGKPVLGEMSPPRQRWCSAVGHQRIWQWEPPS